MKSSTQRAKNACSHAHTACREQLNTIDTNVVPFCRLSIQFGQCRVETANRHTQKKWAHDNNIKYIDNKLNMHHAFRMRLDACLSPEGAKPQQTPETPETIHRDPERKRERIAALKIVHAHFGRTFHGRVALLHVDNGRRSGGADILERRRRLVDLILHVLHARPARIDGRPTALLIVAISSVIHVNGGRMLEL